MGILSIIALIFCYFLIKYLFKIIWFMVIISLLVKLRNNLSKIKDKRRK
jgi:hypothetical protein